MIKGIVWRGFRIGMTIIGTTIGAGFASGREIWEFFTSYGEKSGQAILVSMGLFALASMVILYISWKIKTKNYYEVLTALMGNRLAKIFDGVIFIFLISGTLIMIAGSGATFKQWGLPFWAGVAMLVLAVTWVLTKDVSGLITLNSILMPVLTVVLIGVSLKFIAGADMHFSNSMGLMKLNHAILTWPSSITYASLNLIPLLAVLSTFGGQIKHRGDMLVAGGTSALGLGIIAYLLNGALLHVGLEQIELTDIPLFSLMENIHPALSMLVTVVLWLAIYTTAVSNVHGITYRIAQKLPLPAWMLGLLMMALIAPLTQFGFTRLVKVLYPFYGMVNLFILALLMLYPLNRRGNRPT